VRGFVTSLTRFNCALFSFWHGTCLWIGIYKAAMAAMHKREANMSTASTNLVFRNDTILGICEAIGQDFGFHANWLRLALAGAFYWFPFAVIGIYLGLGVVVAFTRWAAPDQIEADSPKLVSNEIAVENEGEIFAKAA
jgi:phage shock protein C